MKNGLTTQAGSRPAPSSQVTDDDMKKINVIFELFAANYPWWQRGKNPTEVGSAKMLWLKKLKTFSIKQVASAADRALNVYADAAPTVGQFLGLLRVNPAHKDTTRLLGPPSNNSVASANIAKMREVLSGNC